MLYFKVNNRKQQLDKYEQIVREKGWLAKNEQFASIDTDMYVILDNAKVVGYYALKNCANKQVEIKWLYILPSYQGNHYGKNALVMIIKTLYKMNKNTVFCRVDPNADDKRGLYLAFDFGYLTGIDQRLYDPNKTRTIQALVDDGAFVVVFYQKSWGETQPIMKKELEDVFNN